MFEGEPDELRTLEARMVYLCKRFTSLQESLVALVVQPDLNNSLYTLSMIILWDHRQTVLGELVLVMDELHRLCTIQKNKDFCAHAALEFGKTWMIADESCQHVMGMS